MISRHRISVEPFRIRFSIFPVLPDFRVIINDLTQCVKLDSFISLHFWILGSQIFEFSPSEHQSTFTQLNPSAGHESGNRGALQLDFISDGYHILQHVPSASQTYSQRGQCS